MKTLLLAGCLALVSFPAFAKDLTITLSDDEQKALMALIDAGVKAGGVRAVSSASLVLTKLQEASKQAAPEQKPADEPAK